jgi:hypothetical protein
VWNTLPDTLTDTSTTGALCAFNPVVTACNCNQDPAGVPAGTNFQAAACVGSNTTNCGGGSTDTRDFSSCTCIAPTVTHPPCPSPWDVTSTYTQTVSYSLPTCAAGAPVNDFSTCTCSKPDPLVTNPGCGPGYNTGGITLTQNIISGTCTYDTGTSVNTCGCECPGGVCSQTVTVTCPAPFAGTGTQVQTFDTTLGVCAWDKSAAVTGCGCPANTSTPSACGSPFGGGNKITNVTYGPLPTCTKTTTVDKSGCTCPVNTSTPSACGSPFGSGTKYTNVSYGPLPTCTKTTTVDKSGCACPTNTSTPGACSAPFGSGTQYTNVSYGAAPTCTKTTTVDQTGCACPTNTSTPSACPAPFGAGTQYTNVSYGAAPTCTPTTTVDQTACACPAPVVTHPACPSPWDSSSTETVTQNYGPAPTCTPLAPITDMSTCVCNTTPQPGTRTHDCSSQSPGGSACWSPVTQDNCTTTNVYSAGPPATCTVGSQVCDTSGTCQEGAWTLQDPVDAENQFIGSPPPNIDVGDGCSCTQHAGGGRVTCSEPGNLEKFSCLCQ